MDPLARAVGVPSSTCRGCRRGNARGFTLLEVLIAVTITGLVLSAAYGVFFATYRATTGTAERLDRQLTVQRAADRLRRELEAAVVLPRDEEEDGTPPSTFLRFLTRDRFEKKTARLSFTCLDPAKAVPVVYEYTLENNELIKRGRTLVGPENPVVIPLLGGIEAFEVSALFQGERFSVWDSDGESRLPETVTATITPQGGPPVSVTARPRRGTTL